MANKRIVTSTAILNFPYLNKMDTEFNRNEFHTQIYLKKEEAQKFIDTIKKEIDEYYTIENQKKKSSIENQNKKSSIQKKLPWVEDDEFIILKAKSKFKPKQFDGQEEVDKEIKSGSIVKLSLSYKPYNMMGNVSVTFYIDALQIIELKDSFKPVQKKEQNKSAKDYGFSIEDTEIDLEDARIDELFETDVKEDDDDF